MKKLLFISFEEILFDLFKIIVKLLANIPTNINLKHPYFRIL